MSPEYRTTSLELVLTTDQYQALWKYIPKYNEQRRLAGDEAVCTIEELVESFLRDTLLVFATSTESALSLYDLQSEFYNAICRGPQVTVPMEEDQS